MKTHLLTMLVFLIFHANAFSQTIVRAQSDVGGGVTDVPQKLCLAKDGGFLAAGTSNSDRSRYKTENRRGDNDYWVVKYSKDGTIEWDRTIGGKLAEYLTTAIATKDGGYLLVGSSSSPISGEKTEAGFGQSDYWLVKLDSAGTIQWDKTLGDQYSNGISGADETSDGGYILLGDMGITKLDGLGHQQWLNTNISSSIGYSSIRQINKGRYLLARSQFDFVNDTVLFYPAITITDSLGNMTFDTAYATGPHVFEAEYSAQRTNDGGAIIYGLAYTDLNKIYQGSADILKIDKNANLEWRYTTTDFDSFYRGGSGIVLQPTYDGYVFAGTYHPYALIENQVKDYFVGKLDLGGHKQWYQILPADNEDVLTDIEIPGRNYYLICGISSSGISGIKTRPPLGNGDYWIVLLRDTSGAAPAVQNKTVDLAVKAKGLLVYPNPAKDILYVQAIGKATIVITDQSGKTMFTKVISNKEPVNVSKLNAGLYYVKNIDTGEIQKVIITR